MAVVFMSSSDQSESSIRLIESVSDWLADYQRCRTELSDLDVPCGDCAACCQSSMFILIRPQDTEAKQAIAPELRFRAPGLPDGFEVMGFDERGHCPMYQQGCSIYAQRPTTCRQFDCRIFAISTVAEDQQQHPDIAASSRQWQLNQVTPQEQQQLDRIAAIRRWWQQHQGALPEALQPPRPSQQAVLVLDIYQRFPDDEFWAQPTADIVTAISQAFH